MLRIQMATKWCLTQLGMNEKAVEDLCLKSITLHEGAPAEEMKLCPLLNSKELVQILWLEGDDSHNQRHKQPTFVCGK